MSASKTTLLTYVTNSYDVRRVLTQLIDTMEVDKQFTIFMRANKEKDDRTIHIEIEYL